MSGDRREAAVAGSAAQDRASAATVVVTIVMGNNDGVVVRSSVVLRVSCHGLLCAGRQVLAEAGIDDVIGFVDTTLHLLMAAASE